MLHGIQLVLLVGLLISEVIIEQHQLLQHSSFNAGQYAGASGVGGSSPRSSSAGLFGFGRQNNTQYQHLPGADLERGKGQQQPLW